MDSAQPPAKRPCEDGGGAAAQAPGNELPWVSAAFCYEAAQHADFAELGYFTAPAFLTSAACNYLRFAHARTLSFFLFLFLFLSLPLSLLLFPAAASPR